MTRRLTILSALLIAATVPVQAQMQPEGFSAGIALTAGSSSFIGDNEASALPLLRYDSRRFSIGVPDGARITLFENEGLRFSGVFSPRLSAIDGLDAPELAGIDRDITLDIGGQVDYRFGRGTSVFLRTVTELTNEHGGQETTMGVRQALPLSGTPVFLGAGVSYLSGDLSEYVYGVRASDTGFAPYAPGDVFIPYVNIGASFPLTERVSLVGNLQAEFLPDEVFGSPIIDDDITIGGLIGLSMRF
ncbi:MAG: MipA/OmpV family protein [Roseicyclus sp.]|nr:MipA/OmpV family protein [Roseicyclus sp.]MBO6626731.1 MipA/OmpV family protein [Roseicyclus sp.]